MPVPMSAGRRQRDARAAPELSTISSRLRPGDQHGGRHFEVAVPELLDAADVGHRFAARAALDQRGERRLEVRPVGTPAARSNISARLQPSTCRARRCVSSTASVGRCRRRSAGLARREAFAKCHDCVRLGSTPALRPHAVSRPCSTCVSASISSSRLPSSTALQLVRREVDAVIGHAALREVIGANLLGAIAGADLALALLGDGVVLLLQLRLVEADAQHLHRLGAVLDLRLFVLLRHHRCRSECA